MPWKDRLPIGLAVTKVLVGVVLIQNMKGQLPYQGGGSCMSRGHFANITSAVVMAKQNKKKIELCLQQEECASPTKCVIA